MIAPSTDIAPATTAWTALQELASSLRVLPLAEASAPLALAACLTSRRSFPRTRGRNARLRVEAGAYCEIEKVRYAGSPPLAPVPGAFGATGSWKGVTVYESLAIGFVEGRRLVAGERFLVSRREHEPGEWVVVADRTQLRIVVGGHRGGWIGTTPGVPVEGRILGVVEAVVTEHRRAS